MSRRATRSNRANHARCESRREFLAARRATTVRVHPCAVATEGDAAGDVNRTGIRADKLGMPFRILSCLIAVFVLAAAHPALSEPRTQAMKGWELYSWQASDGWRFALTIGTNRLKFCTEVKDPRRPGMTIDELEGVLGRLAEGQYIFWQGPMSADRRKTCGLAFPPPEIVTRIREFCRKNGLIEMDHALPRERNSP
jgi:hypothetical protein